MAAPIQATSNIQNVSLDKRLLNITWEDKHLDEIKRWLLNDSDIKNTYLSKKYFQQALDLIFDKNNQYRGFLLRNLNNDFNIFSDPQNIIKTSVIDAYNSVINKVGTHASLIKSLNDLNTQIASIQQQISTLGRKAPPLLQTVLDTLINTRNDIQQKINGGEFNDFFQPFEQQFYSNNVNGSRNKIDLQKFLETKKSSVDSRLSKWFQDNNFSSNGTLNLSNLFVSRHERFYQSFLEDKIKKSVANNKKGTLPVINQNDFNKTFDNLIESDFNNLSSDISENIKDSIYFELKNVENSVENYFVNDYLLDHNLTFNEQYQALKNSYSSQQSFFQTVVSKINDLIQNDIQKNNFKVMNWNEAKTINSRFEVQFAMEDSRIQHNGQNIIVNGSFDFSLSSARDLLSEIKNRLEEFEIDSKFPSAPSPANLNNFLNTYLYKTDFRSQTWNQEFAKEKNLVRSFNNNVELIVSNFQDNANDVEVKLVLVDTKNQISFAEDTLTFKKSSPFAFDEKDEEDELKSVVKETHQKAKDEFIKQIPDEFRNFDEIKNILDSLDNDLSKLLDQQMKEIEDELDPSKIQTIEELEMTIAGLIVRFGQDIEKVIEENSKKLEKFKDAHKVIEELNDALGEDVSMTPELAEQVVENLDTYQKIMDSPLVQEREALKNLLNAISKNPELLDLIRNSTNFNDILNSLNTAESSYKYIYFGAGALLGSIGLTGAAFSSRSFAVNNKLNKIKNSKVKKASLRTASLFTIFTSLVAVGASVVLMLIFFLNQGGFSG